MKTRLMVIILVAIFALSAVAFAQAGAARARHGEQRGDAVAKIVKVLDLTQEQTAQIRTILKGYFDEVKAVMKSDAPREEKIAKIKPLKETAGLSIMDVLTPEQREKAEKMNLVDRLLSPGKDTGDKLRMAIEKLDLSDAQKTAIKAIFDDSREAAKAIKEDASLSDEAKKAKFAELKKDTLDKVKAQLTPEQLRKLEAMINDRPKRDKQPRRNNGGA